MEGIGAMTHAERFDTDARTGGTHDSDLVAEPSIFLRFFRRVVPHDVRLALHVRLMDTPVLSELMSRRYMYNYVGSDTQMVIDGLPRSGNSYARHAFLYANPGVRLATHGHSKRLIKMAVRRGIPTVVLVREPDAVLASGIAYEPTTSRLRVLRWYGRYLEAVEPIRDRVVVSTFKTTTEDFGAVIKACNDRFGCSFAPHVAAPDAEAAVFEAVESDGQASTTYAGQAERFESLVSLPSEVRVLAELPPLRPREQKELARAWRAYQRLIVDAVSADDDVPHFERRRTPKGLADRVRPGNTRTH